MQGVTILSESVLSNFTPCLIFAIVFFIMTVIIAYLTYIDMDNCGCAKNAFRINVLIFVVALFMFYAINAKHPTYTEIQKVIIDDTVSFNNFNAKYEIVSQDGLIYEVKVKESEEE